MNLDGKVTSSRVDLVGRQFGEMRVITDEALEVAFDSKLVIDRDEMLRGFRANLTAYLTTWQPEKIVVRWPRSWWQHFKERWFPKWLRRRHPVRYEEVMVERYVVYPEIRWPLSQSKITAAIPILEHHLSQYTESCDE